VSVIASRIRLLRLLGRAGSGLSSLFVALELIRAVLPAAQAPAVGRLVAVLFGAQTPTAPWSPPRWPPPRWSPACS
jgi:hypothetical protein